MIWREVMAWIVQSMMDRARVVQLSFRHETAVKSGWFPGEKDQRAVDELDSLVALRLRWKRGANSAHQLTLTAEWSPGLGIKVMP